jgi:hypothetical protein
MTEEFDDSQYVTLEEAQEMIVASEKEIQDLVKQKELRGKMVGNILKIYCPDLETFDQKELKGLYLLGTPLPPE